MRFCRDWCKHYRDGNVPREHVCDAKLVLVGEAPGNTEVRKGIPFCGESGMLLEDEVWKVVGLKRDDLYITNVLPYKPFKSDPLQTEPKEQIQKGITALQSRLKNRVKPNVIIPVGNLALYALTGRAGIMKWRGSVLSTPFGKCIPTIHPAAVLRSYSLIKTVISDWRKIVCESAQPTLTRRARSLIAVTSESDKRLQPLLCAPKLAVDIETNRYGIKQVKCISFASSPDYSVSVDCRRGIPNIVRKLCENSATKILAKGFFDAYVLQKEYGIRLNNWTHDVTLLYHALDNNVGPTTQKDHDETEGKSIIKPYSLAYMGSIFLNEEYWKEEAFDDKGDAHGNFQSNWFRYQTYNARDAAYTFEIAEKLEAKLQELGRFEWYTEQYADLIYPLLDLSLHGVRFNTVGALHELTTISTKLSELRREFIRSEPTLIVRKVYKKEPKVKKEGIIFGAEYRIESWIKIGKTISCTALTGFLQKILMLKGVKSVDEISIRQLMLRIKELVVWKKSLPLTKEQSLAFLGSVLEYRKLESKSKFLQSKSVDPDGRVRSEYSMLIQTGRLSSSKNPNGTGMNLQNQKRDIRHFYIPDYDDWYFLSVDYSQAEDLVVKALSGDERAMELVSGVQNKTLDIHTRLAKGIFNTNEIDYSKRYVAKRARHAGNYGMQDKRFQQVLLKDGFVMPLSECSRILAATNDADPWVREWQQKTRYTIQGSRRLVSSWGWTLDFTYERLRDTGVFRRGYAFIPQSEVGVSMKQYGLKFMWNLIKEKNLQSRINMLVHDELVLSCPRNELYFVATNLTKSLQTPRTYKIRSSLTDSQVIQSGMSMWIPTDLTISKTLKCTCGNCQKPLTIEELLKLSKEEFYTRLDKWQANLI